MIFDSHAHYDDARFDEDREELLMHLPKENVGRVVNIGADMPSSKTTYDLAQSYDYIYAAVGVHPSDTDKLVEKDMDTLAMYAKSEKVVAIGEIGLDYHWDDDPSKEIQEKWFRRQLDLAVSLNLPVAIHSRDAAEDTMKILKEYDGRLKNAVMHCFGYSAEMAAEYVKMGYYIGIGGVVTFKNGRKMKEVVAAVPMDRIVIETDCPYLSPEPNRGARNDSRNLKYVVSAVAQIKGISEEEVEKITWANACKLYGID